MTRPQQPALGQRPDERRPLVLVLGAGVIGVTAAYTLLERGYAVTIVARESAHMRESTRFASPWAGAVWCPFSDTFQPRQSDWERATFNKWAALKGISLSGAAGKRKSVQAPQGHIDSFPVPPAFPDSVLSLVPFRRVEPTKALNGNDAATASQSNGSMPWWRDVVPNFQSRNGLLECTTFALDAPAYLATMQAALEKHPHFTMVKAEVTSLVGACAFLGTATACVVNATGLGAASLTDVQDAQVEPIGGQLIRLRAVNETMKTSVVFVEDEEASSVANDQAHKDKDSATASPKTIERLYMIPRALSGEVVLGGTEQYSNCSTTPSPQQTRRILTEMLAHCPWMRIIDVPDDVLASGGSPQGDSGSECRLAMTQSQRNGKVAHGTAANGHEALPSDDCDTYQIIGVDVGLRPSRKGGPRLELDACGITTSLIEEYDSSSDSDLASLRSTGGSRGSSSSSALAHTNGHTHNGAPRNGPAEAGHARSHSQHKAKIPIVHAYGFGKTGYQASWGVAQEIAELVDSQLRPAAEA